MGVINLGILVKKIMGKISGAGYIKDTDYASSSKGGTIKVDSTYATDITSGGKLKAKEITAEAYAEANDAAFISKATLDNVLASQGGGSSVELLLDSDYSDTIQVGSQYLRTIEGKDLTQYKFLITGMTGSGDQVLCAPMLMVTTARQMGGWCLTNNGNNGFVQVQLAKSSGSEIYDSVACTYNNNPGKWGPIYGIK